MPGVLLLHSASSWGPWQKNLGSPKLCLLLEWLEFNDWSVRNMKAMVPHPQFETTLKGHPSFGARWRMATAFTDTNPQLHFSFAQSCSLLFPSCSFFPSYPFLFPPFFFFLSLSFPNCWFQKHYLVNLLHTSTYLRICLPGNPTCHTSGQCKTWRTGMFVPL